jgi:hypothetical protein
MRGGMSFTFTKTFAKEREKQSNFTHSGFQNRYHANEWKP